MHKFLLICYAFPPSAVVGALRPYRLCRYLPNHGWFPEVIAAEPEKGELSDQTGDLPVGKDINVHRTKRFRPLEYYRKRSLHDRTRAKAARKEGRNSPGTRQNLDLSYPKEPPQQWRERVKKALTGLFSTPDQDVFWGFMLFVEGARVLRRSGDDLRFVLTTSPPHSSQIFGCLLAKAFRKPHIIDLRDPWTDVYRGYQSYARRVVEKKMEKWVIENSACVISSTAQYTKILRRRYHYLPESRFQTVTNGFEEEKFETVYAEPSEKFTMAYLGIFYPRRNPYCFFEALQRWLRQNPDKANDVEFRLIGECDRVTASMIKRHNLESIVRITGHLPHKKAIEMAKGSDLLLLLAGTGPDTPKGWVPSKLYEYLACKKPILANIPLGQASEIIKRTGSGFVVSNDDPQNIIKFLDQEYSRKRNPAAKGLSPFVPKWDEIQKFGNKYCTGRFAEIFNSLS